MSATGESVPALNAAIASVAVSVQSPRTDKAILFSRPYPATRPAG